MFSFIFSIGQPTTSPLSFIMFVAEVVLPSVPPFRRYMFVVICDVSCIVATATFPGILGSHTPFCIETICCCPALDLPMLASLRGHLCINFLFSPDPLFAHSPRRHILVFLFVFGGFSADPFIVLLTF